MKGRSAKSTTEKTAPLHGLGISEVQNGQHNESEVPRAYKPADYQSQELRAEYCMV